ncbi:matrixin [Halobium salinum]|uniref:Matrixin n=1 Tax=Halobium salinum TaxID=1364940 RepID=A0ABD5PC82_9EURY|nr:matrixin [Halobium salinum]
MRSSALPTAFALLLVLSGCVAPSLGGTNLPGVTDAADTIADDGNTSTATPSPTTTSHSNSDSHSHSHTSSSSTDTAEASTAAPPDPAPARDNPWGTEPVVVAVENRGSETRNYVPQVEAATAYWEEHARRYAGFDVEYVVRPDAPNPDLVVRFVDEVPSCGEVTDAAGCAPFIQRAGQVDRPERVLVRTGLSASSTTLVLQHELGHTLGLGHDDAPTDVMKAKSVLYTQPRPDATDRAFPWGDTEFGVYVDDENAADPEGVREQVRHALSYYERGANGSAPSNLSFTFVDSPEAADVVVEFAEDSPCGEGSGSCFTTVGPDPDGDDAIETYTRLTVVLVDLDTEAVGWHVGNWLAYGLGMEAPEERPPPFRDAGYRERRGAWWT